MNELQFAGAKWWKFDFHTHTLASDFSDEEITHKLWLKAFMDEGIDCVAITDHNSGGWIDDLKRVLNDLKSNPPKWYKPLYLFPGVEIGASDGVHILAIFGEEKDESHIDRLLGAVGSNRGVEGKSGGLTSKSTTEVIDEIVKCGGIPIPAHVDRPKGLLEQLKGSPLEQVLENENIYAMELRDSNYQKPQLYIDEKLEWTEIIGSDVHDFSKETFGTFTWVKMDEPSIEGLKLALQDGDVSVNRNMNENPNILPNNFIEKLEISNAKYIGRVETLECNFSPFLNTIIGGRGTGKSTILEFIRLVMRRDRDLRSPNVPETLEKDSLKYFHLEENDSLLNTDTKISLLYRKNNIHYRLNWSPNSDSLSLEQKKDDDTWEPFQGEIKTMFPVYIYSQKQIYELARNPRALIDIIDKAPEVEAKNIETRISEVSNRYKQIESKQQELNEKIDQKIRLLGEFNDLARQIEYIEKSGHTEVMQKYRLRQQQLNELDTLENKWKGAQHHLLETLEKITPSDFNKEIFNENSDILSDLQKTNDKWWTIHNKLKDLGQEAESILNEWQTEKDAAPWMQKLNSDIERYEQSRSDLEQQGIDPDKYHLLLTQQKSIQKELDLIDEYQSIQQTLETEKKEVFNQIRENRNILTEKRQEFLTSVLHDNRFVSIEVLPFGEEWDEIENEIRSKLQCPDRFDKDIENLKDIYQPDSDKDIEKLKDAIEDIRNGNTAAKDNRFATHLIALPQESISDFLMWFPRDNLEVTYGPDHQRIQKGSPGQKTAALLAFILFYGDEPLLLDQPEDDLDNALIYDLIVRQLRETKTKRQVIVVTHNANIVVNGDAEMVLPLAVRKGQTEVQQPASIQKKEVREAICSILEGGERAFEQRYKRIHLGD